MISRDSTILLGADSINPWAIPADPNNPWPDGADAHTVFKNTAGATLADVEADEVTETAIKYLFRPEDVGDIPAGARFDSFIETDDGPMRVRHGVVQLAQSRFTSSTVLSAPPGPRSFTDSFQRAALGWTWEIAYGKMVIIPVPGQLSGVGTPDIGALLFGTLTAGGMRYYRPLTSDTPKVTVTIVLPPGAGGPSNGEAKVGLCQNQRLDQGLMLNLNTNDNRVHLQRVTSPTTSVDVAVSGTVTFTQNDSFTAFYNDLTKTFAVYRGTSTSPMFTPWVDNTNAVPHGPGYRYLSLHNVPTFAENGPLISGWAAKDEV